MSSRPKRTLNRTREYADACSDTDSVRTPSPIEHVSRPRKRKHLKKNKRYRDSHRSLSSNSSNSYSSTRHGSSKREYNKKDRRVSDTSIPNVLEKLINLFHEKSNTGAAGSVGPGLQGSQNVIPKFDPNAKSQTMKNWLAKVNESAHVFGWTERQTIFYALPKLEGLAKRWYEGLTTVKHSWAEWQEKLIAAFPCEYNYGELLAEMLGRRTRKSESLEEYYYDKMTLINRCELTGKHAVDCLTYGIYDYNVKMYAQGCNFNEPEEVLTYLRNVENKTNNVFRKTQNIGNNGGPYKKTFDSQRRDQVAPRLQCFNCKEPGHMVTMCPKPIVKCTNCRRFGHTDQQCKTRSSSAANFTPTTKNIFNIACKQKGLEKYYKQVLVDNQPVLAFIDLGSQCTLLNEDLGKRLNVPVDKNNLPTLNGFGNGRVVPAGRIKVVDKYKDFLERARKSLR